MTGTLDVRRGESPVGCLHPWFLPGSWASRWEPDVLNRVSPAFLANLGARLAPKVDASG
jgi:hypothetical protein